MTNRVLKEMLSTKDYCKLFAYYILPAFIMGSLWIVFKFSEHYGFYQYKITMLCIAIGILLLPNIVFAKKVLHLEEKIFNDHFPGVKINRFLLLSCNYLPVIKACLFIYWVFEYKFRKILSVPIFLRYQRTAAFCLLLFISSGLAVALFPLALITTGAVLDPTERKIINFYTSLVAGPTAQHVSRVVLDTHDVMNLQSNKVAVDAALELSKQYCTQEKCTNLRNTLLMAYLVQQVQDNQKFKNRNVASESEKYRNKIEAITHLIYISNSLTFNPEMDAPFAYSPTMYFSPPMVLESLLLSIVNMKISKKAIATNNSQIQEIIKNTEKSLQENKISASDELYKNFHAQKELFLRKMASQSI